MKRNKFLILIISFIILSSSIVSVGAVENLSDRADALSRSLNLSQASYYVLFSRDGTLPGFTRPTDNRDFIPTDIYEEFSHVRTRSNIVLWPINICTPSGITTITEYFNIDSWLEITFFKYVSPQDGNVYHSIAFKTLDADQQEVSWSRDFTSYDTSLYQGFSTFIGSSPSSLTPLFRSDLNYAQPDYNVTRLSDGTYAPLNTEIPGYAYDGATVYFQYTISATDLSSYFNSDLNFYFFFIHTYSGCYSIREWGSGDLIQRFSYFDLIRNDYSFSSTYSNNTYSFDFSYQDPLSNYDFSAWVTPHYYIVINNDNSLSIIESYPYYLITFPLTSRDVGSRFLVTGTGGKWSNQALVIFGDSTNHMISYYARGDNTNYQSRTDLMVTVPEGAAYMYICSYQQTPRLKLYDYRYNPMPSSPYSIVKTDSYYALSNSKTTGPVLFEDKVNNKIKQSGEFPKYFISDYSDISIYVVSRNQYNTYMSSDSDQKTYDDIQDARDDYINASNELSEALEGFEELNKPDVDSVKDIIHSEQIDNAIAGISSFSPIYQTIFNQDIVLEMLMISLTFVFIGYILFGKRN